MGRQPLGWKPIIVRDGSGALQQVFSPFCLADIHTVSATSYKVDFYYSGDVTWQTDTELYEPGEGKGYFATCTIAQDGSTNWIKATSSYNGGPQTIYEFEWSEVNHAWTLISPDQVTSETRGWDSTTLVETDTLMSGATVVSQSKSYYQDLPLFGQVVTQRVVGTTGVMLTNRWSYYDSTNDGFNYGRVKLETDPSGSWRHYEYDTNGVVTREISQFLNASSSSIDTNLCRVVYYDPCLASQAVRAGSRRSWARKSPANTRFSPPTRPSASSAKPRAWPGTPPATSSPLRLPAPPQASMASPRVFCTPTAPWTSITTPKLRGPTIPIAPSPPGPERRTQAGRVFWTERRPSLLASSPAKSL